MPRVYEELPECEVTVKGPEALPDFSLHVPATGQPGEYAPARTDPNGNRKRVVLAGVRQGLPLSSALALVGIDSDAWFHWENAEPDLAAGLAAAREVPRSHFMSLVAKAAELDWKAAAWLLEKLHPKEYGKQAMQAAAEVRHHHTHEHTVTAVSRMSLTGRNGLAETARALLAAQASAAKPDAIEGELAHDESSAQGPT